MTKIGVRELKAKTAEILRRVGEGHEEVIITRHGKPLGKIVPVAGPSGKKLGKTLRGSYRGFPDLSEDDFGEAKELWNPKAAQH